MTHFLPSGFVGRARRGIGRMRFVYGIRLLLSRARRSPWGTGRGKGSAATAASDHSTHRVPQTSPSRAAAQAETSPRAHVASGEGAKCRADRLHIPCTVRPRELTNGNRQTACRNSGSGIGKSNYAKYRRILRRGLRREAARRKRKLRAATRANASNEPSKGRKRDSRFQPRLRP